jgi:hypothetical protein
MTNEIVKKIFAADTTVPIDGLVVGRKAAGLWLIRDRLGKTITARSDLAWRPNVDWVTVQSGRIVARAQRRGEIQKYEV